MAQDAIDEFIALPKDQQLQTLQQLAPEKQDKLLGEIKIRKNQGDVTAPIAGQGLYEMTDKSGKTKPISYSKVNAASKAGWKMTKPAVIKKYVADTAADPNINTQPKGSGTRVVGRNSAGQPILAPEEPNQPQGGMVGRAASSFGQALGGAAAGLYHGLVEGPQNPEEAQVGATPIVGPVNLRIKRMLIDPAKQQAEQAASEFKQAAPTSLHPTQEQLEHRQKAAGHALATVVPGVGPWAAQVGEQLGTQIGTGDVAGAVGTAAGNAALYAAPHAAKLGGRLVGSGAHDFFRGVTNTDPRALRKMAQETIKKNADAATEAAEKNAKAAKDHLEKTQEAVHETAGREEAYKGKVKTTDEKAREEHAKTRAEVAKKNSDAQTKHAADVAKVREENAKLIRDEQKRIDTQQRLDVASKNLDQKIEKAKAKAKADDDAAWDKWREKVGAVAAPSDEIVGQINASKSSLMDPADVAEFRKVLKETKPSGADLSELQNTRNSIAKENGLGKSYDEATPENKKAIDEIVNRLGLDLDDTEAAATRPVNATRLHVWKTQLEYAVRNATRGNVVHAIGQVLDKVRDTETKLSEEAGAGNELATAREIHGPYKDTFVNSPNEPATVASKTLAETSPEYAKTKARTKRLEMLGKYDPSIVADAKQIDSLRSDLDKLPDKGPAQERLKPLPAPPELIPEPEPPVPAAQTVEQPLRAEHPNRPEEIVPVQKTLTPEEIKAGKQANIHKSAETLRDISARRALYSSLSAVPMMIMSAALGHPGYALAELVAAPTLVLGGGHLIADFLERPGVAEALTKLTPRDVAAVEKFPPAERAVIAKNLGSIVKAAEKKGIRVSPALKAFVAGTAATAGGPNTLKQIREQAQRLQQPATSAPEEETEPSAVEP